MKYLWRELPFGEGDFDGALDFLMESGDAYDSQEKLLMIADVSTGDEGEPFLHGVMTVPFDPEDFALRGEWDVLDNPVEWALESVPAPGTGAPDRMGLMEADEAARLMSSRPGRFFDARKGVFCLV